MTGQNEPTIRAHVLVVLTESATDEFTRGLLPAVIAKTTELVESYDSGVVERYTVETLPVAVALGLNLAEATEEGVDILVFVADGNVLGLNKLELRQQFTGMNPRTLAMFVLASNQQSEMGREFFDGLQNVRPNQISVIYPQQRDLAEIFNEVEELLAGIVDA